MTNSAQYILQHLFGASRLEDVSVDQLKELVNEYPAFNVGHYLLSVKLQKEKDEMFFLETQKTALYFHNPFWLQWLLHRTEEKPMFLEEPISNAYTPDPGYQGQDIFRTEQHIEGYHSLPVQKEEGLSESYVAPDSVEEIFHQTIISETVSWEKPAVEIKDEYQPAQTYNQEAVQEMKSVDNKVEEVYHETFSTENPVFEQQTETVKEEYPSAPIEKEEAVQEIHAGSDNRDQGFSDAYITGNPVLDRYDESIKEEQPSPAIQKEETSEARAANKFPEEFHETYITENPVFEEQAETVNEEDHPAPVQREEEVTDVAANESAENETYYETHITENTVFEEYTETIKEEYPPAEIQKEEEQEVHAANNSVEDFHETYITENPVFEEQAETINEEHSPATIQKEEVLNEFPSNTNAENETYHETHITENAVFEEYTETIKEEYPQTSETEEAAAEISAVNDTSEERRDETFTAETPAPAEPVEEIKETFTEIHAAGHNGEEISHEPLANEATSALDVPEEITETHHPQSTGNEGERASPVYISNSDEQVLNPKTVSSPVLAETSHESKTFELTFEPYHTIDYFASQGIKFIQEENPTDKFGKQLKSFTDWLKQMKKLPHHALKPLPEDPDDTSNAEIEIIAANSIEEKDVETETMAEVLAKQGKTDKAIELYLKLSLLNPTKIAYFAAKIEQIKRTLS